MKKYCIQNRSPKNSHALKCRSRIPYQGRFSVYFQFYVVALVMQIHYGSLGLLCTERKFHYFCQRDSNSQYGAQFTNLSVTGKSIQLNFKHYCPVTMPLY